VDQRLELAARLLGFHVFYVNWVRTNGTTPPLSDYHAVLEHINPRLGLLKSSQWSACEDVINANRQTRSFNEKTQDRLIFNSIIATIVGTQEFVSHVIEQSSRKSSHDDMDLSGAIQHMSQTIHNSVDALSFLYPSYTFFPLLDVRRDLEVLRRELEMVERGFSVLGHTASGKSIFLSSMVSMLRPAAAPVVHANFPDDNEKFLEFCNSMNPDTPDLTLDNLNNFIKDFGEMAELHAAADDAKNVDVLFGPPHENKSTVSVTSAIRLLPQGNKGATTSHVATRILNNDSLPWNIIKLYIHSLPKMEEFKAISRDYRSWMDRNPNLVQELAGKVLTLHVPGDCDTEAGQRGRVEAFFNLIHGVFHADIHEELGSKTCRITYPGAIRLIELARPTNFIFPAFQDSIGGGETDNTLSNPDSKFKMLVIFFTHIDCNFLATVRRAFQNNHQVLAVYNYSKAWNGGKEALKPPNYLAQNMSSVDSVVAKVKKQFESRTGTHFQVVALDSVSAAGQFKYLKLENYVKAEQLWNLPGSIQASGTGGFLYAMHDLYVRAVLDLVEYDTRFRRSMEELKKWHVGSFSSTRQSWVNDIRGLPASDMVWAVVAFACKGDLCKFSSLSLPQLDPVPQTTKKSVGNLAPSLYLLENYMDVMETIKERCAAIEDLGTFSFIKTRSNDGPFCDLLLVAGVLQQEAYFTDDDVEKYARVKGECLAVYQDLTEKLVHYFCETYDQIPRYLKSVAVEAAVLFLRTSCLCLKESVVVLDVSPPTEDDGNLSMEEALNKQVKVRSVSVGGEALQDVELRNHATQFLEMGKYVMYRVVEQMSMSTLKVKTFREPTMELVKKTLLHYLRVQRQPFVKTLKNMGGLDDVGQIVTLLRTHLVRSFETYLPTSTMAHFKDDDKHPGFYVTGDGKKRAEERETITKAMLDQATPILEQLPTFVKEAVFSTRPLDQFVEMFRAIMSVDREGLRRNNHAPFAAFYLDEDEDLDAPPTWIESLKTIVNSPPLETVEDPLKFPLNLRIQNRHELHVTGAEVFSTARGASAYMLGMERDVSHSKEVFADIINDEHCKDPKVLPFQKDFLFDMSKRGFSEAAALDRAYALFTAQSGLDLGALVKTMGMSIAHLLPTDWAYLFPGKCHMPLRYQGLGDAAIRARHPTPLRPQSCMTATGLRLKPKDVLAVPDDLYTHLQQGGQPTLAEVRDRLQTYAPTGEDLFYCIFFELIMVSITTKRAIAVVIYEDDGEVHEHIIRPHLILQASDACKAVLREADSVYKNMEEEKVKCRFGPTDGAEPLEVIAVYKGYFYVCEGSYVGEAMPLRKHAREEGESGGKEGGDKKAREEVPCLSPRDGDEDFEAWLARQFPE
jgi:hypothetical protein